MLVLKPGQHIHIGKGRIHAFRKLYPAALPPDDCHSQLRRNIMATTKLQPGGDLCISVAWDWLYRGATSEGISREFSSVLENTSLISVRSKISLAIPELCLLQTARALTSNSFQKRQSTQFWSMCDKSLSQGHGQGSCDILRGMLPSLRFVIERQLRASRKAIQDQTGLVSVASRPNSWENPNVFAVDPYGAADFYCKLCHVELSNVYMHCTGCDELLDRDFNICVDCHASNQANVFINMNPMKDRRLTCYHHIGNLKRDKGRGCGCRALVCVRCAKCAKCSCKCHQEYVLHHRLLSREDLQELLAKVESIVGEDEISFSGEISQRLLKAKQGP